MSLPGETYITTTHSLQPEIVQCDSHTLWITSNTGTCVFCL